MYVSMLLSFQFFVLLESCMAILLVLKIVPGLSSSFSVIPFNSLRNSFGRQILGQQRWEIRHFLVTWEVIHVYNKHIRFVAGNQHVEAEYFQTERFL